MSRTNMDHIIAHVDLLRSIDRLLSEAEAVRKKRAVLRRLLTEAEAAPRSEGDRAGEADAAPGGTVGEVARRTRATLACRDGGRRR